MTSTATARQPRIAAIAKIAVAGGAIAISAMVFSPRAHAESFHDSCIYNPGAYATGAEHSVYTTKRVGSDRYEICKLYDKNEQLLGEYDHPDYGFYSRRANLPPGSGQVF
jgi:hypothetical protein